MAGWSQAERVSAFRASQRLEPVPTNTTQGKVNKTGAEAATPCYHALNTLKRGGVASMARAGSDPWS